MFSDETQTSRHTLNKITTLPLSKALKQKLPHLSHPELQKSHHEEMDTEIQPAFLSLLSFSEQN